MTQVKIAMISSTVVQPAGSFGQLTNQPAFKPQLGTSANRPFLPDATEFFQAFGVTDLFGDNE